MTELEEKIAEVESHISRTAKMLATMNAQKAELQKQFPFPCVQCMAVTKLGDMIYLRQLHYGYDNWEEDAVGGCECPHCGTQMRFNDPKKWADLKYLFKVCKDKYN